ncbi:di-heme-cytochrome C peroxidase [Cellvibrio sp. NN19]|uniref:di-heme-cytochrome C peroxidase n=1 Tax=Cellvibrio chitinivorans TaxID=3102792 RepID=UPI002B40E18A|nr:di-heme-cytochrome C peroxidase [Cellvibrio sp. NN19]
MPCLNLQLRSLTPIYRAALILSLGSIASCTQAPQSPVYNGDRTAKITHQDSFGDSATRVVYPEQNWSASDSLWFYDTPQGSTLIPYAIFLHLETADSSALFRGDENMNRLRYLPQLSSASNPDGLPVGWVKDNYSNKDYIGFTCAACHTSQINYQGTAIRIDGGAALADMEQMLISLAAALQAALDQPEKFDRLARKVLQSQYPANTTEFRAELAAAAQQIAHYNQINTPIHNNQTVAYGYARLDAFGRIYNRILAHLTPNEPNANPANAPVSYPHLWDTPQHDFVQWNGVGDNEGRGPLERNVGEALGVFAHFDLNKKPGDIGYRSSVRLDELVEMEEQLGKLWSPSWNDLAKQAVLPPINQALAEQGQKVFIEYQCNTCHEAIDRTDPDRRITAQFASINVIGTDPMMAMNALKQTGKMGFFTGQPMNPQIPNSPVFPAQGAVLPALSAAVAGVIAESERQHPLTGTADNSIKTSQRHVNFEPIDKRNPAGLAAYKARPLNGVWATAPYLHNGSVPSLYELFMPSCSDAEIASGKTCRPNRFTLGVRELDAIKVGAVQRDPAKYPGLFVFDTRLPSNSNKGHEYAAGVTPVFVLDTQGRPLKDAQGKPQMRLLEPISDHQRLALVEYLKTL